MSDKEKYFDRRFRAKTEWNLPQTEEQGGRGSVGRAQRREAFLSEERRTVMLMLLYASLARVGTGLLGAAQE